MLSGFPSYLSEPGFLNWDAIEPLFFVDPLSPQQPLTPLEPLTSNSGSDNYSNEAGPAPPNPPNRNEPKRSRPGSCDDGITDERKLRRMQSNRESAQRSRVRKQKHLLDLRTQTSRLEVENRELGNRVRYAVQQIQFLRWQNECLQSESAALRRRLGAVRRVLNVRLQLQQHFNHPSICMHGGQALMN